MKEFFMRHPVAVVLSILILASTADNMYANHVRMLAYKQGLLNTKS